MRFICSIGDSKSIDIFVRIVGIASKICKKRCYIRITPGEFSFVNAYNAREGISIDFRILKNQLFSNWIFDGISPRNNVIFFSILTDDLVHSLHVRENQMKLKLTKKDDTPHFRIELGANSLWNDIPIELIVPRQWSDYNPPNMGNPSISVTMPPMKIFSRIMTAAKNMGGRALVVRASIGGEMTLAVRTDSAHMQVYTETGTNQLSVECDLSQQAHSDNHFFQTALDLRNLHAFLSNLHPYVSRLTLKIVEDHGAIFCANELECQFTLYMAAIND